MKNERWKKFIKTSDISHLTTLSQDMKILIVGHGYLGGHMAALWHEREHEVSVTARSKEKRARLSQKYPHTFLAENLDEACKGQELVLIAVAPKEGASYSETYLDVAQTVQKYAGKAHLLYISSTSIYGDHEGALITEETAPNPQIANAETLLAAEEVIRQSSSHTIFRLGEIIGPGRTPEEKIKRLSGKTLPGSGENPVNLSPLSLIEEALLHAAEKKIFGTFNLCTGEHPLRKEYYNNLAKKMGLTPPTWDKTLSSRHGGAKRISSEKWLNSLLYLDPDAG